MGFFFYDHSDHYEEDEFSQMVVGGSGGSLLESQPSGRASSSESLTARRGRCEVDCRRPRGGSREAKIHWEGANQMDPDGEGWCRGDFVAGLGTRFVGGLRGFVAAPIGKSTGGMTSVPSDFCGPGAPVKQHIELEKIIVRRGDGAVRLKLGSATARQPYHFGNDGVAPNAHSARQRLSKNQLEG